MALLEGRLPKNAQSWNENLVDAFTKRADVARGKGQQQWHKWQKDADKIRAVRKHIYQQQSGAGVGAIKNLPKDLSSKGLDHRARPATRGPCRGANLWSRGGELRPRRPAVCPAILPSLF